MGLKEQMGRAVMNRISAMPSVKAATERAERLSPAIQAATQIAYGRADDEAAKDELRSRVNDVSLLAEAAIETSERRQDYVRDRAYRLLSAAAADGTVQPMPPERAELFGREAALGRLPMDEAFGHLAILEPALVDIETEVRNGKASPTADGCSSLDEATRRRARELVGGASDQADDLLRSNLAGSIVNQYLQILAGATHLGKGAESFFETPRKALVASHSFGRRPGR